MYTPANGYNSANVFSCNLKGIVNRDTLVFMATNDGGWMHVSIA